MLRAVHGGIRFAQKVICRLVCFGEYCHANAGTAAISLVCNLERYLHGHPQFVGHDLRGQCCAFQVLCQARHQHDEFVTTDARQRVATAHHLAQPHCRQLEKMVTHWMAMCVVDVLEMIEINEQNGALETASLGQAQRIAETVGQQTPVR